MDREDGIYYDIKDQEYFENTDRINASQLKKLVFKTPKHLGISETSNSFRFGKFIHKWFLEPEKVDLDCKITDINPPTSKPSKKWITLINENPNTIFYTKEELDLVSKYKLPVDFNKTKNERVIYFTDEITNLKCKCKLDAYNDDTLYDIKSVSDVRSFEDKYFKLGYWFSMAFYAYGYMAITGNIFNKYQFVVLETNPPFNVSTFEIDMSDFELFFKVIIKTLKEYKSIKSSGIINDYNGGKLKISGWKNKYLKEYLGE